MEEKEIEITTPTSENNLTEEVVFTPVMDEEPEAPKDQVTKEANYKEMSPLRLVLRRFFRSKLSIVGIVLTVFLFAFSFLGPVIYDKWGENEVDQSGIVIVVETPYEMTGPDGEIIEVTQRVENVSEIVNKGPMSWDHLLGTDEKGMDIFTRLMYGGRISLLIGFIVVILETVVGVLLGGLAGYFGKWVDQVIMRIVDMFNCIPTLPILLIASAVLESLEVPGGSRIYFLMVVITFFGWAGTARLVRGQILSLREQEYMTATEVMGLPTWRKIFKHLMPNVMPQLIVSMTLGLGSVIMYESTLSYLGLGVQQPFASWGSMVNTVNTYEILANFPNIWLPAGICICLAILGFNFIGDGLRDAMDPKARK